MKKGTLTLTLLCCLLALSACTAKRPTQTADVVTGPRLERVAEFFRSYIRAFNSRDMDRLVGHYADDSRVRVFGSKERFTLDKKDLLAALELKRSGWESRDLRFVGFDIMSMNMVDDRLKVNIAFRVQSSDWSGEYPVTFKINEDGREMTIYRENA